MGGDENARNKKLKSLVWDHFEKGETPTSAVCNYCKKELKTSDGSTTSLLNHLRRFHRNIINSSLFDRKTLNVIKVRKNLFNKKQTQMTSPIWMHFRRNEDRDCLICTVCEKEFRTPGNTSNLRRHILRCTRGKVELQKTILKRRGGSIVWNHFIKTKGPKHLQVATCKHCNRTYKTSGSTSNLRDHLARRHQEILIGTGEANLVNFIKEDPEMYGHSNVEIIEDGVYKNIPKMSKTLSHTLPSKRYSSFVWLHFQKTSVPHRAICNHCSKEINSCGSTSTLRHHLMKYHKEKIKSREDDICSNVTTKDIEGFEAHANNDVDMKTLDADKSPSVKNMSHQKYIVKRNRSFVWEHFEKTLDSNTAICIYCREECRSSGNTSNLMQHLIRHHKSLFDINKDINHDEEAQQNVGDDFSVSPNAVRQTNANGMPRSFIWDHFERNNESGAAICNYCSKSFNTIMGNTSGLMLHLGMHHPEMISNNKGEVTVKNETPSNKSKRIKSFVWDHFDKIEDENKAFCCHCSKIFNTFGNTSNLKNHLLRKHKNEIKDSKQDDSGQIIDNEGNIVKDELLLAVTHIENEQPSEHAYYDRTIEDEQRNVSKKHRPRSLVWSHFERTGSKKAKCLHCQRIYTSSGNTSNLKNHLERCPNFEGLRTETDMDCSTDFSFSETMLGHENETKNQNTFEKQEVEEYDKNESSDAYQVLFTSEVNEDGKINLSQPENATPKQNNDTMDEFGQELVDRENTARSTRSLVWRHFQKCREPNMAICLHCGKKLNTSGNTTNIRMHLLRFHENELMDEHQEVLNMSSQNHLVDQNQGVESSDEDDDTEQDTLVVERVGEGTPNLHGNGSAIWKHFEKMGRLKAVCNYCSCLYASQSTANLWKHLKTLHNQELEATEDKQSDEEIIYIYCDKECETSKNTDLKTHLLNYHQDRGQDVSVSKDPDIWEHFKKINTPQFAVCNYCHTWCEVNRDASNLRTHLISCQRQTEAKKGISDRSAIKKNPLAKFIITGDGDIVKISAKDNNLPHEPEMVEMDDVDLLLDKTFGSTSIGDNFEKSQIPNFFACKHCGKLCKANRDASSLTEHLANSHEREIKMNGTDNEVTEDKVEKRMSDYQCLLWKHFEKINGKSVAKCNYCDKTINARRVATSLRNHLMSCHKDTLDDEVLNDIISFGPKEVTKGIYLEDFLVPEEVLRPPSKNVKPTTSLVWSHFRKSNIRQFAICNHCQRLCKTCGNTSNLKNHLLLYHEDKINEQELEYVSDKDVVEEVDQSAFDESKENKESLPLENNVSECEINNKETINLNGLEDDYLVFVVS